MNNLFSVSVMLFGLFVVFVTCSLTQSAPAGAKFCADFCKSQVRALFLHLCAFGFAEHHVTVESSLCVWSLVLRSLTFDFSGWHASFFIQ